MSESADARARVRMLRRSGRLECTKCVYFIQTGEADGPVKIGVARDPWARMGELQVGNHDTLRLLGRTQACDAYSVERRLHRQFSKNALRGEWFAVSPDLFRVIERLCGDECYMNGDARSMIGLLWPYGEDITPEMVRGGLVELLEVRA